MLNLCGLYFQILISIESLSISSAEMIFIKCYDQVDKIAVMLFLNLLFILSGVLSIVVGVHGEFLI